MWQKTTKLDIRKQQAVHIEAWEAQAGLESSQSSSSTYSSNGKRMPSDSSDSPVLQPASKRVCQNVHVHLNSEVPSNNEMNLHSNPIDDMILSKRIGTYM